MSKYLLLFIYPFLLLNITLSDGFAAIGLFPVGVFFYWGALLFAYFSLFNYIDGIWIKLLIGILLVLFAVLNVLIDNQFIYFFSLFSKAVIIAFSAAITTLKYANLLKKQMFYFLITNLVIMILQVIGISESLHILNTLFYNYDELGNATPNIILERALFRSEDSLIFNSAQSRPPGVFHSNAILSPVLLGIFSFLLSFQKPAKLSLTLILTMLSIAICMSKISVTVTVFLIGTLFFYFKERSLALRVLFVSLLSYLLYYIFLPGFFVLNLNLNAFYHSSYYRIIDIFLYLSNNPEQIELLKELSAESSIFYSDDSDFGSVNGISKILKYVPVLGLLTFIYRRKIVLRMNNLRSYDQRLFKLAVLMLVFLVLNMLPSNLLEAPIFHYYCGMALLFFIRPFLKLKAASV
jgi:hypothetical protein